MLHVNRNGTDFLSLGLLYTDFQLYCIIRFSPLLNFLWKKLQHTETEESEPPILQSEPPILQSEPPILQSEPPYPPLLRMHKGSSFFCLCELQEVFSLAKDLLGSQYSGPRNAVIEFL